ncbi:MAG: octanoyltransferase [candidate division Zixibacteria bacterium CG_4_9_14_3_um_filter_46_8]|nr:MAG: octanoyltransferase [candidate division Zixibacteria bacterium CG_4_9_14_3_um_filter_46_8]
MPPLNVITPGLVDYGEALHIQYDMVAQRAAGEIDDTLILLEHNPVITFGRGGKQENVLATTERLKEKGVKVYKIERGGDVTFHGPGQLVGYPIIDLNRRGRDMHKYLRDLETVLIETLKVFGLEAGRKEKFTGVWNDNSKLAAIGVAVRRWISYHGFALNVNNDLSYFGLINPCGITDAGVSSLSSMLGRRVEIAEVIQTVIEKFAEFFKYEQINRMTSLE